MSATSQRPNAGVAGRGSERGLVSGLSLDFGSECTRHWYRDHLVFPGLVVRWEVLLTNVGVELEKLKLDNARLA